MIGQLTGTVAAVDSTTAVVDVNGIGFAVRMPNADLATLHIGNAAVVHTEMMVSQDAITLYGFLSMESKRMFLQLLKVNGIGPKVALSLLSTLPSRQLAQAIHDEDATALAKAPGLGKKRRAENHPRAQGVDRFRRRGPRGTRIHAQSAGRRGNAPRARGTHVVGMAPSGCAGRDRRGDGRP